jgi:hypothetical protein
MRFSESLLFYQILAFLLYHCYNTVKFNICSQNVHKIVFQTILNIVFYNILRLNFQSLPSQIGGFDFPRELIVICQHFNIILCRFLCLNRFQRP